MNDEMAGREWRDASGGITSGLRILLQKGHSAKIKHGEIAHYLRVQLRLSVVDTLPRTSFATSYILDPICR